MPRMTRMVLVAVLLVTTFALPAAPSAPASVPALRQAAPVVIDFDDLTTTTWGTGGQTVVADQYADQGVTFNTPKAIDFAGGTFGVPDFVHSGTNAVQQCYSEEFCDRPLVLTFDKPQNRVKVWVGFDGSLDDELVVRLAAFDAVQGGAEILSASAPLGPSDARRIPVQTPLEAIADGNAIRRVEVGFSPASDFASSLIFDDVEFEVAPSPLRDDVTPEQEPATADCPSGTTPPEVVLERTTGDDPTHLSDFTLLGSVATSTELTAATLTAASPEGISSENVLTNVIAPRGGAFGPVTYTDALQPGANTLTLTVRNCAGEDEANASVTFSQVPAGTRYDILGLEVTQTIQGAANSVTLIAGKSTYVRVYLRTRGGADTLHSVSGRLRGCHIQTEDAADCLLGASAFTPLEPLNPITIDDSDNLPNKRWTLESSLIYRLPLAWASAGFLRLQLDQASLSPPLPCDNCENVTNLGEPRIYEFIEAPPVSVNLVDITYRQQETRFEPDAIDHMRLESWLERAYPTSQITVTNFGDLPFDARPTDCYQVNTRLFEAQTTGEIASPSRSPDAQARYYGLVASPEGVLFEGCAGIDETGALINQFASGPAGFGDAYDWDTDGSYADFYAGHELAHTYMRLHPGHCVPNSHDDDFYPFEDGYLSDGFREFFGFDPGDASNAIVRRVYTPAPWRDIMTYCPNRWISHYTYEGILQRMVAEEETPPGLARLSTAAPSQEVLLVSGTIDLDNNTGILRPFSRLPGDLVSIQPTSSPPIIDPKDRFSIELKDQSGAVLEDYPFTPRIFTDRPPNTPVIAQLSEVVAWAPGTEEIVITRGGQRIASRTVSPVPPIVQLISPNGSENLQRASETVTWSASDLDGEELTYTLLYSTDAGTTWQTAAAGITEQQYDVDVTRLPGSDTALFRIIATDGVNTGQDDSDAVFSVPPKAPAVRIISPEDRSSFGTSHTIVLTGAASDVEQGDLDDAALQWSSDIQGDLGEGTSIAVSDLTPGLHTISLTATDSDGMSTAASITLEIVDDTLPTLHWDASGDPSHLSQGQFSYDNDAGVGTVYTSDGNGGIQQLRTFDRFLNGWTAIVPGNFGGDDALTDLLLYSSQPGLGEFYASDGEGGLQLLSGAESFTKGWDFVVPGNFGGNDDLTDLFFYDLREPIGKFYTTDGEGQIRLLGTSKTLLTGWTSIVAGNFGGDSHTDLLFYDKTTGLARFYTVDGRGGVAPLSDDAYWTKGWDQIVAGSFGGDPWTDLFFYDDETMGIEFSTTDGEGEIDRLGSPETLRSRWPTIVGGDFGGDDALTDLFFYDGEAGRGTYYTTDGSGELEELSSSDAFPRGWDLIVPGHFAGS